MDNVVEIQVSWPGAPPNTGQPLLDDSLGQLSITINDNIATHYPARNGAERDRLFIPTYHVAEWVSSNWWALLHEPPKNEDYQSDFDFRARRWLGAARNGFALPDLWFCPASGKIEIIGHEADLTFAQLSFLVSVSEVVDTDVFSRALARFIEKVISRLDERGEKNTELHQIWHLISA